MNNIDLWLFIYRDAVNKQKYMAVYETKKEEAIRQFIANREPTDRLMDAQPMTKEAYRAWMKNL